MLDYVIIAPSSQCEFEVRGWVRIPRDLKLFFELFYSSFHRSVICLRDDICQGSDEGCNLGIASEVTEIETNSHSIRTANSRSNL